MSRLLLLRHAKSSWGDPALPDIDRPLAARGRRDAAAMAKAISERGLVPDRILCSTARRTRETLAALLPYLGDEGRIAITESLYQPPGGDYRSVIAAHGANAGALMVIGHNPAIQATALLLGGGEEPGPTAEITGKYPTGALAVIEFDTDDWSALSPHSGRISAFIKPRQLEDAGNADDDGDD
jgi:phosphohistidine phosphatase